MCLHLDIDHDLHVIGHVPDLHIFVDVTEMVMLLSR